MRAAGPGVGCSAGCVGGNDREGCVSEEGGVVITVRGVCVCVGWW